MNQVWAETYYSEYSKYSDFDEKKIEVNELTEVITEDRYLWYQEKKVGDYFIEGENPVEYQLLDDSQTKETTFSKWEDEIIPEEKKGRTIEHRTIYRYQEMKPFQYLHMSCMQGKEVFRIATLEILAKGKKIEYEATCQNCEKEDDMAFIVKNGGHIYIDLKKEYQLEDLTIMMELYDDTTTEKRYQLDITYDAEGKDIIATRLSRLWFTSENKEDVKKITLDQKSYLLMKPEWEEEHYTTKEIEETISRKVKKVEQYRYKDQLHYYYYYKRTYKDKYDTVGNQTYPIQDIESKKTFYAYRTRDKVVLKEPIIITTEEQKIEDFIVETTSPIEIDQSKVKLDKNGTYSITIKTKNQKITKEVVVTKNQEDIPKEEPEPPEEEMEVEAPPTTILPEEPKVIEPPVIPPKKEEPPKIIYKTITQDSKETLAQITSLEQRNLEQAKKIEALETKIEELTHTLTTCQNENSKQKEMKTLQEKKIEKSVNQQGILPWGILGLLLAIVIVMLGRKMTVEKKF